MATFTVKQLIEELKKFDEDLPVYQSDWSSVEVAALTRVEEGGLGEGTIKNVILLTEIPF